MTDILVYASNIVTLPGLWNADCECEQTNNTTTITIPWSGSALITQTGVQVIYTHIPPVHVNLDIGDSYPIEETINYTQGTSWQLGSAQSLGVTYVKTVNQYYIINVTQPVISTNNYSKTILNVRPGDTFAPTGETVLNQEGTFTYTGNIVNTIQGNVILSMSSGYILHLEASILREVHVPTYMAYQTSSPPGVGAYTQNYIIFTEADIGTHNSLDGTIEYHVYPSVPLLQSNTASTANLLAVNGIPSTSLAVGILTYTDKTVLYTPPSTNTPSSNSSVATLFTLVNLPGIPTLPGYDFTVSSMNNYTFTSPGGSGSLNVVNNQLVITPPYVPPEGSTSSALANTINLEFDTQYTFASGTYQFAAAQFDFTLTNTTLSANPTAFKGQAVTVLELNSAEDIINTYNFTYLGPPVADLLEGISFPYVIPNIASLIATNGPVNVINGNAYTASPTASGLTISTSASVTYDVAAKTLTLTSAIPDLYSMEFITSNLHKIYIYHTLPPGDNVTTSLVVGGGIVMPTSYVLSAAPGSSTNNVQRTTSAGLTTYQFTKAGTYYLKSSSVTNTIIVSTTSSNGSASINLGDNYSITRTPALVECNIDDNGTVYSNVAAILFSATTSQPVSGNATLTPLQAASLPYITYATDGTYTFYNLPLGQSIFTFEDTFILTVTVSGNYRTMTTITHEPFFTEAPLLHIPSGIQPTNGNLSAPGIMYNATIASTYVVRDTKGTTYDIHVINADRRVGNAVFLNYTSTYCPPHPPKGGVLTVVNGSGVQTPVQDGSVSFGNQINGSMVQTTLTLPNTPDTTRDGCMFDERYKVLYQDISYNIYLTPANMMSTNNYSTVSFNMNISGVGKIFNDPSRPGWWYVYAYNGVNGASSFGYNSTSNMQAVLFQLISSNTTGLSRNLVSMSQQYTGETAYVMYLNLGTSFNPSAGLPTQLQDQYGQIAMISVDGVHISQLISANSKLVVYSENLDSGLMTLYNEINWGTFPESGQLTTSLINFVDQSNPSNTFQVQGVISRKYVIATSIEGVAPLPSDVVVLDGYLLTQTPLSVASTHGYYNSDAYNTIVNPQVETGPPMSTTSLQ